MKTLILSATGLSFLFLVACDFQPTGSKIKRYPSQSIVTFMQSCVGAGSSEEICFCSLDHVRENVSWDDFALADMQTRAGNAPKDFVKALANARSACE